MAVTHTTGLQQRLPYDPVLVGSPSAVMGMLHIHGMSSSSHKSGGSGKRRSRQAMKCITLI